MVRGDKRESLVRAAMGLFHRNGYGPTSLADIAEEAEVPLGNVYYYFKTREDILRAVVQERLTPVRAGREALETTIADPRERLLAFVAGFEARTEESTAFGCPAGGLCYEMNKQGGAAAEEASVLLRDVLEWVFRQFRAMGFRETQARDFAARLIAARQGSILLSNTFKDPQYIKAETARLKEWIASLPSPHKERKRS